MRMMGMVLAAAASSAVAADSYSFRVYDAPTGLRAELPGTIERFDKWTDIAKGRVIQLTSTIEEKEAGASWPSFRAYYFVQAVIADKPYDIDAKLREFAREGRSDAASSSDVLSRRMLKPSEMPLPGMKGYEVVATYNTFGSDGTQIEVSRNMVVGNKWLSVSVRAFDTDKRWPAARLFNSVKWAGR